MSKSEAWVEIGELAMSEELPPILPGENPYAPPQDAPMVARRRPTASRSTELFIVAVVSSFLMWILSFQSTVPLAWLLPILLNLAGMRAWAWSRWQAVHGRPWSQQQGWQLFGNSLGLVSLIVVGGLAVFWLLLAVLTPYGLALQLPDGTRAPASDTVAIAVFVLVIYVLNLSWPPHRRHEEK